MLCFTHLLYSTYLQIALVPEFCFRDSKRRVVCQSIALPVRQTLLMKTDTILLVFLSAISDSSRILKTFFLVLQAFSGRDQTYLEKLHF